MTAWPRSRGLAFQARIRNATVSGAEFFRVGDSGISKNSGNPTPPSSAPITPTGPACPTTSPGVRSVDKSAHDHTFSVAGSAPTVLCFMKRPNDELKGPLGFFSYL